MCAGQPLLDRDVELHRRRAGATRARSARAPRPEVAEDRRDAARGRARAAPRGRCRARATRRRAAPRLASGRRVQPRPREPQLERDGDEPLLGAVVEVALEPAALLVAGLDEPRARRDEVGAGLGAGDRERGELAERAEPVLGVRRGAGSRSRSRPPPTACPRRRSAPRRSTGTRCGASPRRPCPRSRPSRRPAPALPSPAPARPPTRRSAGIRSPTRNTSIPSRLWRPTIDAVPSPS